MFHAGSDIVFRAYIISFETFHHSGPISETNRRLRRMIPYSRPSWFVACKSDEKTKGIEEALLIRRDFLLTLLAISVLNVLQFICCGNKVAPTYNGTMIASMPYSTRIFNLVLLASLLIVVITSFHRCIVGALDLVHLIWTNMVF
jgi:hypothetical protein